MDQDAQTQLLTKQAELQLAEEAGVIPDISFEAFLIGMERENIRRSQAAVNKEVVYGPKQLDAQAYYSYYMSNLEDATIDAMRRNGSIVITAEQERLEYEANLAAKYSKQGTTRVEWVTLPYGPESEYKDQSGAMDRMKELLAAVTAGRESTGTELTGTTLREQAEELGVYTRELTVTSTSRRTAALENPLVLLAAEQLAQGQVSSLIVENGAVHLLYCLSKLTRKLCRSIKSRIGLHRIWHSRSSELLWITSGPKPLWNGITRWLRIWHGRRFNNNSRRNYAIMLKKLTITILALVMICTAMLPAMGVSAHTEETVTDEFSTLPAAELRSENWVIDSSNPQFSAAMLTGWSEPPPIPDMQSIR